MKEAIDGLRALAREAANGSIIDGIDAVEQSYRYMLQYAADGVSDPERDRIYNDIIVKIKEIADVVVNELVAKGYKEQLEKARLDAEGPNLLLCQLIALRRREAALQGSEIAFLPGEGRLVHYLRGQAGGPQLEVYLNAGTRPEAIAAGGADLFALAWDGETLAPGGILIRRV